VGKSIRKGDYVLATKYSDGDPQDHFVIGFYDGPMDRYAPPRYNVVDASGKPFRGNGFSRVAKISPERGQWLIGLSKQIELSGRSVWWWKRAPMISPVSADGSRE
jgi:hypothetical protein